MSTPTSIPALLQMVADDLKADEWSLVDPSTIERLCLALRDMADAAPSFDDSVPGWITTILARHGLTLEEK